MNKRTIDLSGHIIDSLILTKTMGIIMDKGGEFDILEIEVGRKKSDISHAKIEVSADSPELLESILDELSVLGASIDEIKEVNLVEAQAEEQEIKLRTSAGSWKKQESSRKTSISALLTMPKPLTV